MMTAMMTATATMMPRTAVPTMMTSPAALLPSPAALLTFLPAAALENSSPGKFAKNRGTPTIRQTLFFHNYSP